MCKVKFPRELFPWEVSEKKPQSTLLLWGRGKQCEVILNLGCTLRSPGELKTVLVPGPSPGGVRFNCSVVWSGPWTFFWKLPSLDSNVQPRWTLIESKLTSQMNSVNFLRGCAHSAFPVCGLISIRSDSQLEHPEVQRDAELSGYDKEQSLYWM